MEFIYLFTGLAIGVIIGYLIMRLRARVSGVSKADYDLLEENSNKMVAQLSGADKEIQLLKDNLAKETEEHKSEQQKSFELNAKLSANEAERNHLRQRLEETNSQIEEMQARMKTEFENLANRILEDKSSKFTEQNKVNLDNILKPLQDKLKSFEDKVHQTYTQDVKDRATLMEQIKTLQDANIRISEEANNLTRALKGESKTQGNWGELILETVLEKSGLVKNREYFIQESLKNDEGKTQRPDVVVKLPDERYIIIDSKVSLKDYEAYASAEDGNEKASALKSHIASVRGHIKELSDKKYHDLYSINSPDFVLMFMPVEPALSVTVQAEQNIWNEAFEKSIVIVSPSTLLATLKTIENIWKQELRSKNVMEIAKQGGSLYEKFKGFVEDLQEIGRRLDSAKNSYTDSMKKLSEGRGNLISQAQKLKDLGAKTDKSLPQDLLERASDDE